MTEKLDAVIEALLFVSDKPIPDNILAEITETDKDKIKEAIDRINIRLRENGSPVTIKQIAGGYEFLTLPEYAGYIKKFYKNRFMAKLSRPAMEVLAIIAYKQPITKQEIELIRGVNSDGVFHTLLERKLVKITGRKDTPGRPLIYATTREFMQYLGINSLDDLPKIEEIRSVLEKEENVERWEERVEGVKTQTLFEFEEDGKSVSKRFEEEKSHTQNEKEVDDMGKNKKWQEEYEDLYGEKEEDDAYKNDDYEIKDEEEEEEEKKEKGEEEEENREEEDENYENYEDDEDDEDEIYEENFDELEEEEDDDEEDEDR
ncbi:MAG: SMC-Scp complex subunit ScpB [Candidatus Goldbacteria bacterium]|nr:SMC-Scp complex subunit ScpB [Candidatus Goldiibacteriota bacterium]